MAAASTADESVRVARAPFEWLQVIVDEMAFAFEEAADPDESEPLPADETQLKALEGNDLSGLRAEVAALREELLDLQIMVDSLASGILANLQLENEQLRRELHRMYALHGANPTGVSLAVPRPGQALFEEVQSSEPVPEPIPDPEPPAEFGYVVVEEWGRTPAVAAELGDSATSLKGMVCAVPPGSLRGDIEQLGRDLRSQFVGYDNINIEVFDDPEAAQQYADNHVSNPVHRVLSVSKHKASGRDVVLYLQDGASEELPL